MIAKYREKVVLDKQFYGLYLPAVFKLMNEP